MDNELYMFQNPIDSKQSILFISTGALRPLYPRQEGINANPLLTPAHKLFQKSLIKNLQLKHLRTGHLTPHAPDGASHTLRLTIGNFRSAKVIEFCSAKQFFLVRDSIMLRILHYQLFIFLGRLRRKAQSVLRQEHLIIAALYFPAVF